MSNSIEQAGSLRPESSPTAAFSLWGVGWVLGISTTIHGAVLSGVLMWHELSKDASSKPRVLPQHGTVAGSYRVELSRYSS